MYWQHVFALLSCYFCFMENNCMPLTYLNTFTYHVTMWQFSFIIKHVSGNTLLQPHGACAYESYQYIMVAYWATRWQFSLQQLCIGSMDMDLFLSLTGVVCRQWKCEIVLICILDHHVTICSIISNVLVISESSRQGVGTGLASSNFAASHYYES